MGFWDIFQDAMSTARTSVDGGFNPYSYEKAFQEDLKRKKKREQEKGSTVYTPQLFSGYKSLDNKTKIHWQKEHEDYIERVRSKHPLATQEELDTYYDNKFRMEILDNLKDTKIQEIRKKYSEMEDYGSYENRDAMLKEIAQYAYMGKETVYDKNGKPLLNEEGDIVQRQVDIDGWSSDDDKYDSKPFDLSDKDLFRNHTSFRQGARKFLESKMDSNAIDAYQNNIESDETVKAEALKQFDNLASQLNTEYAIANHINDPKYAFLKDYNKYKDVECLRLSEEERLHLLSKYIYDTQVAGDVYANEQLVNFFKDKLEANQTTADRVCETATTIVDSAVSMGLQAAALVDGITTGGALGRALYGETEEDKLRRKDQSWFQNIFDNAMMQYANDLMTTHVYDAGIQEKMKALGISDNNIYKTAEEENELFNSKTLFDLTGQWGFTLGSMLLSMGTSALAQMGMKTTMAAIKGMNLITDAAKFNSALRTAVKIRNFNNLAFAGAIATAEGAGISQQDKADNFSNMMKELDNTYVKQTVQDNPLLVAQLLSQSAQGDEEALNEIPLGQMVQNSEGGYNQVYSDQEKAKLARLVRENPELKQQLVDAYKKNHAEQCQADIDNLRDIAQDSAALEMVFQSAVNGIINMGIQKTYYSKPMQREITKAQEWLGLSRSKSPLSGKVNIGMTTAADGSPRFTATAIKNGSGKYVKERLKEAIPEGWEEYIQDVGSGLGEGSNDAAYQDYIQKKYGTGEVNDAVEWSLADMLSGGLSGMKESAFDFESVKDGIYGALSAGIGGFSVNQNMGTLKKAGIDLSLSSKNSLGTNIKNALLKVQDMSPIGWRSVLSPVINPSQQIADNKENQRIAEHINAFFQDEKLQAKLFSGEGIANFVKEYNEAVRNGDEYTARNAQFGNIFSVLNTIQGLEGTVYYDTMMQILDERAKLADQVMKFDDYDEQADEQIAAQLQDKDSALYQMVHEGKTTYDNMTGDPAQDQSVTPTKEDVQTAKRFLKNAKDMKQILTETQEVYKQARRDYGAYLDDDAIEAVVYQTMAIKDAEKRIEQIDKELNQVIQFQANNRDATKDKESSFIARHGTKEALQKKREAIAKKVDELEKEVAQYESDKGVQAAAKKNKKGIKLDATEERVLNDYLEADSKYKAARAIQKRLTQDENARSRIASDKISKGLESERVLSAEEIMSLSAADRAIMLNKDNLKNYSTEQQEVIKELNQKGVAKFGQDWYAKIEDRAKLQSFRSRNLTQQQDIVAGNGAVISAVINNAKRNKKIHLKYKQKEGIFQAVERAYADRFDNPTAYSEAVQSLFDYLSAEIEDGVDLVAKQQLLQNYYNGDSEAFKEISQREEKVNTVLNAIMNADDQALKDNKMSIDQRVMVTAIAEQCIIEGIDFSKEALDQAFMPKPEITVLDQNTGQYVVYQGQDSPALARLKERINKYREQLNKEAVTNGEIAQVLYMLGGKLDAYHNAQKQEQAARKTKEGTNSTSDATSQRDSQQEGQNDSDASQGTNADQGSSQGEQQEEQQKQDRYLETYNSLISHLKDMGIIVHDGEEMRELLKEKEGDPAIQELVTAGGFRYGVVYNGEVYLGDNITSYANPVVAYTHLWAIAVQRSNPKLWEKGKELLKKTSTWQELLDSGKYGENEDLIATEILARESENQTEFINTRNSDKNVTELTSTIKEWLSKFWSNIAGAFGFNVDEHSDLNYSQFTIMPLYDFVQGVNPNTAGASQSNTQTDNTTSSTQDNQESKKEELPTVPVDSTLPGSFAGLNLLTIVEENREENKDLIDFINKYNILGYVNTHSEKLLKATPIMFAKVNIGDRSMVVAFVEAYTDKNGSTVANTFDLTDSKSGKTLHCKPVSILSPESKAATELGNRAISVDTVITDSNGKALTTYVSSINDAKYGEENAPATMLDDAIANTVAQDDTGNAATYKTASGGKKLSRKERRDKNSGASKAWNKIMQTFARRLKVHVEEAEKGLPPTLEIECPTYSTSGKGKENTKTIPVRVTPLKDLTLADGETKFEDALKDNNPALLENFRISSFIETLVRLDKLQCRDADSLKKALQNFFYPSKGYIYNLDLQNEKWHFRVVNTSNNNAAVVDIDLGENISETLKSEEGKLQFLKQLFLDNSGNLRKVAIDAENQIYTDLLHIQFDYSKIGKDLQYVIDAINEGVLTVDASTLTFSSSGLSFTGFSANTPVAPATTGQSAKKGSTVDANGAVRDAKTGAKYDTEEQGKNIAEKPSQETLKERADRLVGKIRENSKQFDDPGNNDYYTREVGSSESSYTRVTSFTRGGKGLNLTSSQKAVSTGLGNTVDAIGRDFFEGNLTQENGVWSKDGKPVEQLYPNFSKEALYKMIDQLQNFKACHSTWVFYSNGITAFGTLKNEQGEDVQVAGTVDLLAYDTATNSWHIIDFKTHHGKELHEESKKSYRRQVTAYGDLLTQQYKDDGFELDKESPYYLLHVQLDYPDSGAVEYMEDTSDSRPNALQYRSGKNVEGEAKSMPLVLKESQVHSFECLGVSALRGNQEQAKSDTNSPTFNEVKVDGVTVKHENDSNTITLSLFKKEDKHITISKPQGESVYKLVLSVDGLTANEKNTLYEALQQALPQGAELTLEKDPLMHRYTSKDVNLLKEIKEHLGWNSTGVVESKARTVEGKQEDIEVIQKGGEYSQAQVEGQQQGTTAQTDNTNSTSATAPSTTEQANAEKTKEQTPTDTARQQNSNQEAGSTDSVNTFITDANKRGKTFLVSIENIDGDMEEREVQFYFNPTTKKYSAIDVETQEEYSQVSGERHLQEAGIIGQEQEHNKVSSEKEKVEITDAMMEKAKLSASLYMADGKIYSIFEVLEKLKEKQIKIPADFLENEKSRKEFLECRASSLF